MRRRVALLASVLLLSCKDAEPAADDVGDSEESGSTADTNTEMSDSTQGTESTTDDPSETDTESNPDTDTDDETDTGTDTETDELTCPIVDGPGVESLALSPELFADGADPSASDECAIVNPERGFHQFVDLRELDDGELEDAAADGSSVVYGRVLLTEYRNSPLNSAVLDEIDAGFNLVRAHGMKVVPRFHYSDDIDEPDAELQRILGHIDQLAPLLQEHADVILTLQAGFIGAWGEWHASQNGLDAPGPRKQILDALLAALPEHRTVSVRRPSFKDDAYGGPLDSSTAHDGSALARVGHVNDCFLASASDSGTYQVAGEKDYAIADSAYVPVGGETCAVNPPRSECPSALEELALHHWTYLNADYHPDVLMSWEQDGCYAEIACRLGYRLALVDLRWGASGSPGGVLPIELELFNDGFAAPTNTRPLKLVLDGPMRVEVEAALDIRDVLPGESQAICVDAQLPNNLPPGTYQIGIRLADPWLADDPRQAIRLVNGEWAEGVNWFDATFEVN